MEIKVTVDIVIFAIRAGRLQVLLVQRAISPFKGRWCVPGGFVLHNESLDDAARRELREETGVKDVFLEQLYTFGAPKRDPRGRIVSISYYAILPAEVEVQGGSDAESAAWWDMSDLPVLAFDHEEIVNYARQRLCNKLEYTHIGFELLPEKFTLSELQSVYEAVLGKELDKRNFRRKIEQMSVVKPLEEWKKDSATRPAQYFKFAPGKIKGK